MNSLPSTARAALSFAGPDAAGAMARTAWRQGRDQLAEVAIRKALVGQTADPDDSDTLAVRSNLAAILQAQGKLEEAEAQYREILAAHTAASGVDLLAVRNNFAAALHAQGRPAEAEAEYREILRARTGLRLAPTTPRR